MYETPVGFKYIGELLLEGKIVMGGEESAGFTMDGHVPEKDGILADLLLAELVAETGKSLKTLIAALFAKVATFVPQRADDPGQRRDDDGEEVRGVDQVGHGTYPVAEQLRLPSTGANHDAEDERRDDCDEEPESQRSETDANPGGLVLVDAERDADDRRVLRPDDHCPHDEDL